MQVRPSTITNDKEAAMAQTRGVLDREEADIQNRLLDLGRRVDAAIAGAMDCLARHDTAGAAELVAEDAQINYEQHAIEQDCLIVLATQQPVAGDLRLLIAEMQIAIELERMADHAADIARLLERMDDDTTCTVPENVGPMVELCRGMLSRAMQAYSENDEALARAVAADDDTVDTLEQTLSDKLIEQMCQGPAEARCAAILLQMAHHIERIGDRATNIAERVVFISSGEWADLNP
jgi:phosphate transport system protein